MARQLPAGEATLEAHIRLGGLPEVEIKNGALYALPGRVKVAVIERVPHGYYLDGCGPLRGLRRLHPRHKMGDDPRGEDEGYRHSLYSIRDDRHMIYTVRLVLLQHYGNTHPHLRPVWRRP